MALDVRFEIPKIANYFVGQKHMFEYSEGPDRMDWLKDLPEIIHCYQTNSILTVKITTDCSGFVTLLWHVAGCPDPNGLNYDGEGYTGTLLSHDQHLALWMRNAQGVLVEAVTAGCLTVYGPGTGEHVATIVHVQGNDILTVSMGQNSDPSFVWVNPPTVAPSHGYPVDGRRPQTFLKPNTINPNRMPPIGMVAPKAA